MKKIFLFFFLLSGLGLSAQEKPITLKVSDVSVEAVLQRLRTEFSYKLLFNHEEVKAAGNVSVSLSNASIETALRQILRGTPLTFSKEDGVYVIKLGRQQPAAPTSKKTLQGTVYDKDNVPLIGATISVGAAADRLFTITGADGRFILSVPSDAASFSVTYIGKQAYTGQIGNQPVTNVVVTMEEATQAVEDIVVTGYQVLDRKKLSSSISSLTKDDLDHYGALTVDQMLEGKLPGLMVTSASPTPGAASKMRLRGTSTFSGSREPVWVIDGIIYEDPVPLSASDINSWDNINLIGNAISGLNPNDIERIDVLKDAAATAIYGTRAANGVIVITTKQGKEGQSSINYSGNFKVSRRPRHSDFEMMSSSERLDVSREIMDKGLWFNSMPSRVGYEGAVMDYWDKIISYDEFSRRVSTMENSNTDWCDALFRTAFSQSHNISLSGGANQTRYYLSVGYTDEAGTEKGVDLNRITGRANMSGKLGKKVSFSTSMNGSVQNGYYNYQDYSAFNSAYYSSRMLPVYNADGSYYYIPRRVEASDNLYTGFNILNEFDRSGQKIVNKSFNLTGSINWEIAKGLKYVGTASYTSSTNLQENWIEEKTYYTENLRLSRSPLLPSEGGLYSSGYTDQFSWTVRNQVNYNRTWNDKHILNIDIGQEARSTQYRGSSGGQFPGYMRDRGESFVYFDPSTVNNNHYYAAMNHWFAGPNNPEAFPSITSKVRNNLSFYGTFTYSFRNLYSFNFNMRNDGSNQFGQYRRARFNPTWSVSGRLNLTDLGWLGKRGSDQFAFRMSYGYRGNVPNASPYLLISNPVPNTIMDERVGYLHGFPNGNLDWERTSTVNAAFDFSFINNRISGAVDGYYSYSSDLLTNRIISLVNGQKSRLVNSGSATNYGVEFSIRTVNIQTKKLRWSTSLTVSTNRNKITRGEQSNINNTYNSYLQGSVIKEGHSVDGFYSYIFAGLDERGLPRFDNLTGNPKNMSRDRIFETMFRFEGSRSAPVYGGFSTDLDYRGIRIRANLSYKFGHKVRLLRLYGNGNPIPMPETNMHAAFNDRWRRPGDVTAIPGLTNEQLNMLSMDDTAIPSADRWKYTMVDNDFQIVAPASNTAWYMYDFSDIRVARADFIRVRDISVGYMLPARWTGGLGIKSARVDFQVQNVGVIVFDKKLKGQDPEQVYSVGMPALPAYTLNIALEF